MANFAYLDEQTNIQIGTLTPKEYMNDVRKQCKDKKLKYGNIDDDETLKQNMEDNCIPESIFDGTVDNYEEFLNERRKMMAKKIEKYYFEL